jgi:uncharacterized membrane protein YdjX (TVP38/TMEM64 family)
MGRSANDMLQDATTHSTGENFSMQRRRGYLVILLLLSALGAYWLMAGGSGLWDFLKQHFYLMEESYARQPEAFVLFFLLAQTLAYTTSLPGVYLMTLLAGTIMNFPLALAVSVIATSSGTTAAFLLSKTCLRNMVLKKFPHQVMKLDQGIQKDGAYYLFSLRMAPPMPYFVVNYGLGLTRLRTATYFWVSLVGMLPENVILTFVGTGLKDLERPAQILSTTTIALFILVGTTPLLVKKIMDIIRKRRLTHI